MPKCWPQVCRIKITFQVQNFFLFPQNRNKKIVSTKSQIHKIEFDEIMRLYQSCKLDFDEYTRSFKPNPTQPENVPVLVVYSHSIKQQQNKLQSVNQNKPTQSSKSVINCVVLVSALTVTLIYLLIFFLHMHMNLQQNYLSKHWLFFVKSSVTDTPSEPVNGWQVGDRLVFTFIVFLPFFPSLHRRFPVMWLTPSTPCDSPFSALGVLECACTSTCMRVYKGTLSRSPWGLRRSL